MNRAVPATLPPLRSCPRCWLYHVSVHPLAERLIGKGYLLRIYDSHVNVARLIGANKAYIEAMVPHFEALLTDSIDQVLDCPIVVVGQLGDAVRAALNNRQYGDQLVIDLVGMKETAALRLGLRGCAAQGQTEPEKAGLGEEMPAVKMDPVQRLPGELR